MNTQEMEYFVDIVICMDATGSMGPIIKEVKSNALSFHQKFIDAMEDSNREVSQVRVKVIAFRDYGCDTEPMKESKFFTLPEQNEEFTAFVNSIEAMGGGDTPENALEALALALKSDWTTGGDKRRHVVLMMTDAPALPLGARADSASYPAGMPKDLAQLGAWWEGTDQDFTGTYQASAGRLAVFAPNAEPWTDIQAWNRYWPTFSEAGTGLKDVDIATTIEILKGTIK